jgi:hypothetical protein
LWCFCIEHFWLCEGIKWVTHHEIPSSNSRILGVRFCQLAVWLKP